MKAYISRSAPLRISLRLDFGRDETDFTAVCDLYCAAAGRVSQLSIEHPSQKHCSGFLSKITEVHHPSLETIVVRSHHLPYDTQDQFIFRDAPRLAEIYMDNGTLGIISPQNLSSLKRVFIHHFQLWQTSRNRFHRAVDGSSLEYLELGPSYFEFWKRSSWVTLPNLKTLVIPRMAPDILFHFFEAIRAPNLQKVAISTFQQHPMYRRWPIDPLHWVFDQPTTYFQVPESVTNVFSGVRDLGFIVNPREIPDSQTLSAAIHHFANIFPNVVSLHTDISVSSLHMTFATSSQVIWPDLRDLYFLHYIHMPASSIYGFVLQESRARAGHPIQNIHTTTKRQTKYIEARADQDLRLDWWEGSRSS